MMTYLNSVAYRQMFVITSSSTGREAYPVMFFIHSRLSEELLKCRMLLGAGPYSTSYLLRRKRDVSAYIPTNVIHYRWSNLGN